jgi:hypothetical protein
MGGAFTLPLFPLTRNLVGVASAARGGCRIEEAWEALDVVSAERECHLLDAKVEKVLATDPRRERLTR